jgi:hypothetical protein
MDYIVGHKIVLQYEKLRTDLIQATSQIIIFFGEFDNSSLQAGEHLLVYLVISKRHL